MSDVQKTKEIVECPGCHADLGTILTIEGLDFLVLKESNIVVRYLHGACLSCESEISWNVNDRLLARLVKSIVDRQ